MKSNYKYPQDPVDRQISFFLILAAVVLFSACSSTDKKTSTTTQSSAQGPGAKQPPMMVDYVVVKPTSINEKIEVPGNLLAFESTEIHPEISGRLVLLN